MTIEGQIKVLFQEIVSSRDRLAGEVADLQAAVKTRNLTLDNLNDRIAEIEEENKDLRTSNAANAHLSQEVLNLKGENQNLLRRIGELKNSSTFKLQEENEQLRKENEALRKQVQTAEELLGSPEEQYSVVSEDPEGAKTVLIEAWLVGDDPDELRLMWATEKFTRKNWKFCVRAKDQTTKYDEVYFESYRMKVPYPH